MRRFLKTISIFSIVVVGIFLLIEIALLYVPNEYSFKCKMLTEKGNSINILILGASHSANCIDPHEMRDSAFNAGISGKAYFYDVEIVKRFVPKMKNLKYVVMTITPFQQFRSYKYNNPADALGQLESTQRCMHFKYLGIAYGRCEWMYWSEFINSKLAIFTRFYKSDKTNCDDKGFQPFSIKQRKPDWQYQQLNEPIDFSNENIDKAYKENLTYMMEMVQVCKYYGVIPVFVTVPYYKTAQILVPQRDRDSMYSMINELKKVNPSVRYLNFMDDKRFIDEDFYNSTHVSDIGAKKLAHYIIDEISK